MRELVLQMMTTLNGRLDAPYAWVASVTEDQYEAIVAHYADYDTILVGHTTYDEMVAYWPSALESGEGSASNQRMAQHMHDYRKVVISREERQLRPWNNTEQRTAADDTGFIGTINQLKGEEGKAILLSGGSSLARRAIALGLVDVFRFFVYPTVSAGPPWFDELDGLNLDLVETNSFRNGVVELSYRLRPQVQRDEPSRFTELLSN